MSAQEKKEIRDQVLRKRGSFFSQGLAEEASRIIVEKLKQEPAYQAAESIMCFVSFGTEVSTHQFIQDALAGGKRIFVPYIETKKAGMVACEIKDFSELEIGYFNILTPKPEFRRLIQEEPDLILVPAVAYARDGYRVGYGGGFYDRYLAALPKKIPLIGIGFEVQLVDKVPVESFDMPIDQLITETASYTFNR